MVREESLSRTKRIKLNHIAVLAVPLQHGRRYAVLINCLDIAILWYGQIILIVGDFSDLMPPLQYRQAPVFLIG